jgi:hypothetical protein
MIRDSKSWDLSQGVQRAETAPKQGDECGKAPTWEKKTMVFSLSLIYIK